jgi:hypothetical protein
LGNDRRYVPARAAADSHTEGSDAVSDDEVASAASAASADASAAQDHAEGSAGEDGDSVRVVYVPTHVYTDASSAAETRFVRISRWRDWAGGLSPRSVLTTDSSSDSEAEYLYVDDGAVDVLAEGSSEESRGALPCLAIFVL